MVGQPVFCSLYRTAVVAMLQAMPLLEVVTWKKAQDFKDKADELCRRFKGATQVISKAANPTTASQLSQPARLPWRLLEPWPATGPSRSAS